MDNGTAVEILPEFLSASSELQELLAGRRLTGGCARLVVTCSLVLVLIVRIMVGGEGGRR